MVDALHGTLAIPVARRSIGSHLSRAFATYGGPVFAVLFIMLLYGPLVLLAVFSFNDSIVFSLPAWGRINAMIEKAKPVAYRYSGQNVGCSGERPGPVAANGFRVETCSAGGFRRSVSQIPARSGISSSTNHGC